MALRIDSYWQRTRAQMWAAFYPSSPLPLAIAEGLAILAKYGIEAHLFIPGVGKVNGIDAQNFLESTFVTPAVVNGPVGGVKGSADNVAVTNIRINITSTFGSNYVGIGELRVKDGTGVMINLANATLTASSQYGTWSPDRMKDGGTVHDTQSWRSDGTALPQWVNISFPSPVKAAVVEIQNTNPAGLSESARIGDIEVTNSDSTVSYYPYTRTSDAADAISRHTIGKLHLTQATTANKPMLGVEPIGGRVNVLQHSETFNASPWDGTATHTYESAPTTAPVKLTKITATSATTSTQSVTAAATSCVVSWIVRGVSSANTLVLRNVTTATNLTGCIISPDYTQSTGADITVEQLGDNVRKISITYATGITVGDSLAVYLGSDSGVGDWTEFGGVQLSWGTTIYPYQRTLSAYEAYEDGKDSIYYWQKGASASWLRGAPLFDGTVRDYLSIASARPAQSDNTWSAILDPCSTATGVQTGSTARAFGACWREVCDSGRRRE